MQTRTHWETTKSPERWTVRVHGELDLDTGPRLRGYLATLVGRCPGVLALDLSEVTFCDSSGLQSLLATRRRARLLELPLVVVLEKDGRVHRLLELCGVVELFDLELIT
jgi:anti-anti-sigma factor